MMTFELIPFIKVGNFSFGKNIDEYEKDFHFTFCPIDESGWESYDCDEVGISLSTEEKIIISISCYKECLYKGTNLIGMNLVDFKHHTKEDYLGEVDQVWMNDDEQQSVYEFDKIGLQVWTNEDGNIVTIIASPYISDD